MVFLDSVDFITDDVFFSGVGMSEKSFVKTLNGYKDFLAENNKPSQLVFGQYSLSYFDGEDKIYFTDPEGQGLLFLYQYNDFWAISNSYYALCLYIKKKDWPRTLNKTAVSEYLVHEMLFNQPISDDLSFYEINLIPKQNQARVHAGKVFLEKPGRVYPKQFIEMGVKEACSYFSSYFYSLVEKFKSLGWPIEFELSGGLDSRVIASILSDFARCDLVYFSSKRKGSKDYIVANQLIKYLGGKHEEVCKQPQVTLDSQKRYQAFKLANIGVCQAIRQLPGKESFFPRIVLNGGGALGKAPYGNKPLKRLAALNKSSIKKNYQDCIESKINAEVDFNKGNIGEAFERIYSYRYRYFVGNCWYKDFNLLTLSPLATALFRNIVSAKDLEKFFGLPKLEIFQKNLVHLFLILNTKPVLAYFIADEPYKNYSADDILKVKKLPAFEKYKKFDINIYGRLNEIDFLSQGKLAEYEFYELSLEVSGEKFEDFCYSDLSLLMSDIEKSGIIKEDKLKEFKDKEMDKSLGDRDLVSLLHVGLILASAN
jgi:hypothetical protein